MNQEKLLVGSLQEEWTVVGDNLLADVSRRLAGRRSCVARVYIVLGAVLLTMDKPVCVWPTVQKYFGRVCKSDELTNGRSGLLS